MKAQSNQSIAVAAAISLAEKTAATADALASAKVQSDIASAVMATNIDYIKKDVGEIKTFLSSLSNQYATRDTLTAAISESNAIHTDHETRIRILETIAVRLMTWGSVTLLVVSVGEVLLNHYLK